MITKEEKLVLKMMSERVSPCVQVLRTARPIQFDETERAYIVELLEAVPRMLATLKSYREACQDMLHENETGDDAGDICLDARETLKQLLGVT